MALIKTLDAARLRLPLYALRAYDSIEEEDGYLVIYTYKDKYVLDDLYSKEPDYIKRRMLLSNREGIKLYPLQKLYTTLGQVLNSPSRIFIDPGTGKLYKYKPTKMCKLCYYPITTRKITNRGAMVIGCKHFSKLFKVAETDATHMGVIHAGYGAFLLYELCYEQKRNTRKKV